LEQSLEAVAFDPKEAALIDFARQADRKPHAVTDAQLDKLRETGAQDVEQTSHPDGDLGSRR
jgi:alkylhydroperoxidase family enzyme